MKFGIGRDEKVAVAGLPGTGKTTLCRVIAQEMGPTSMWDPFGQYVNVPGVASYRPPTMDVMDLDRLAGHLWGQAKAGRAPDGLTLGIEEAEQVLEQGQPLTPNVRESALMGRNLKFRYLFNLRRPQDFTKKLLRVCDWLFIMKLAGGDIEGLRDTVGKAACDELRTMTTWTKDPRQGGGRFFTYHDGELKEHPPLNLGKLGR